MPFDEKAYEEETKYLYENSNSDLVFGDRLYELALEKKLGADPPVPLNAREIEGGLDGNRCVDPCTEEGMLRTLRRVLPYVEMLASKKELPQSMIGHVILYGAALYKRLDSTERCVLVSCLQCYADIGAGDHNADTRSDVDWQECSTNPYLAEEPDARYLIKLIREWESRAGAR